MGDWEQPWTALPNWVQAEYRTLAMNLAGEYRSDLPLDFDVGGFNLGDAAAVWTELLTWSLHAQLCARWGSTSSSVVAPFFERSELVDRFTAASRVDRAKVGRIVDLFTLDLVRCPDACLTPLVPFGGGLLPMSSLVLA